MKLRWPCRRLVIVPKESREADIQEFQDVIKDQASVKEVQIVSRLNEEEKTKTLKEKGVSIGTIYLDVSTSEELESERIAKDFIRQVQSLRKKHGYHVSEKIELIVATEDDQVKEGLGKQEELIKNKIGAIKIDRLARMPGRLQDYDAQGEFNYQTVKIQVAFKRKKS